ncbi:MAG: DNA cytosine methyltransferase [Halobacteriovoraceae bacterium]|nr:DNA cytosine methyltransferase [Halobacteriovoraceae bacterium]MCB9095512.1 DNA cytosine methyltransferase [Halobacteriovoraceae bacterium]
MKSKNLNFIDLFCGAGGLSTGLKMAGFREILACDYDKWSTETMKANHGEAHIYHGGVQELTPKKLKEIIGDQKIHLVAGGPPCQGFSTIGKGDPGDERNSLFRYFVKIVGIVKPEFVLFENVTGLVSKKNEKTLQNIYAAFKRIGYELNIRILDAQDYGIPQARRRTFIIGTKVGYQFEFPKKKKKLKTLGETLDELKNFRRKKPDFVDENYDLKRAKNLNDIDRMRLQCIPEGGRIRYREDEEKYLPKDLKLGVNWDKIREKRLRENHYHRLSRLRPSPTLNTHNHHYFHPTQLRKFTLRELAMIQSFPPDYQFKGSRTAVIKQIGNAVPPLLGKLFGLEIKKCYSRGVTEEKKQCQFRGDVNKIRSKAFVYGHRI